MFKDALSHAAHEKVVAAERPVSFVRLSVLACGTAVYILAPSTFPTSNGALISVLVGVSWAYALTAHVAELHRHLPHFARRYFTSIADGVLSTAWIFAFGGFDTASFALYYLSAIAISFRFGRRATLVAATLFSAAYLGLIAAMGQLQGHEGEVVTRVFFIYVISGFVAMIAQDALLREAARLESERQAERARGAEAQLKLLNETLEERVRERTAAAEQKAEELARSQEQLRHAKDAAEAASQAKSSFLANMSHEIRTPLGVMIGFSELLLEQAFTPQTQREYLGKIRTNGEQLLALVNDILDLSKVEAGRLETERSPFSLSALIEDILSVLSPQAMGRGLVLTLTSGDSVPEFVSSDRKRLRQILLNVIGNAVKFTEHGEVSVALSKRPRAGSLIELEFLVRDTGPGLTQQQAQKLFAPFVQADSSATRKFGGTGLGLALSRRLARALGGDVALIESTPGQGSVFSIRVEALAIAARQLSANGERASEGAAAPPTSAPGQRPPPDNMVRPTIDVRPNAPALATVETPRPLQNHAILLVEDALDNQLLVSRFLKLAGATVTVANNGKEGIEAARAGGIDLVLMDIQMPVMNGIQAMRTLRLEGFDRPILALTAHAMKEDREGCLELGFDDHVTKPIDRAGLIQCIARHCQRRRSVMAAPPSVDVALGPLGAVTNGALS